jgi:hypothetical protein
VRQNPKVLLNDSRACTANYTPNGSSLSRIFLTF